MLYKEIMKNYKDIILPYWRNLRDKEYGGYYGYVGYDLDINPNAEKGVILNSRILWFFANAYTVTRQEDLLIYADHAYEFLVDKCFDHRNGGVFWMLNHDGSVKESMKHTYNQAFAIYALSSYYEATRNESAREYAMKLFRLIEVRCADKYGYLEAFTEDWKLINNDKMSENGVLADKTMNTLLHLLEAYTELFKVTKDFEVRERLISLLNIFHSKVFNSEKGRLEVFFDEKMNSIADLNSYGHDIEASWLLDRACEVLEDSQISKKQENTQKY
ncbi:AGE family epimerase/isomerase [Clostridium chromiireducens]|uniref:AGE family epimerase/isomerase n=1 Tax=Clostridium chromiireducens TaxID=225345 RepID=UPI003AF7CFCD